MTLTALLVDILPALIVAGGVATTIINVLAARREQQAKSADLRAQTWTRLTEALTTEVERLSRQLADCQDGQEALRAENDRLRRELN